MFVRPAVDENFYIKAEDYTKENGGIVIANPNAPTGIAENLLPKDDDILLMLLQGLLQQDLDKAAFSPPLNHKLLYQLLEMEDKDFHSTDFIPRYYIFFLLCLGKLI